MTALLAVGSVWAASLHLNHTGCRSEDSHPQVWVEGSEATKIFLSAGFKAAAAPSCADVLWLRGRRSRDAWSGLHDPDRQVWNQLPSTSALTDKAQLTALLSNYEDAENVPHESRAQPLSVPVRKEADVAHAERVAAELGGVWILKPAASSQGVGIEVLPDGAQGLRRKASRIQRALANGESHLLQRYVTQPLLLAGRKCEVRLYWVVLSVSPMVAAVADGGQVRLNSVSYSPSDFANPLKHITNAVQQQKNAHYSQLSKTGALKWHLQRWAQEVSKVSDPDEVLRTMRLLLVRAVNASAAELVSRNTGVCREGPSVCCAPKGRFEVFGADFIFDVSSGSVRPFLTEVQIGPGLSIESSIKRTLLTRTLAAASNLALGMLRNGADIALPDGWRWLVNEGVQPSVYLA